MKEFEKKLLLSKEEYTYLLNHFAQNQPIIKQTNYYFDTEDLAMDRQNITCRIRQKEGRFKATLKHHIPHIEQSTEIELEIRNGIIDNTFIDMGMKLQGELITERCIILENSICEVALDKNHYLGYTDYELEIEYAADHEREACSIFQAFLFILMHRNCILTLRGTPEHALGNQSKSQRFFERRKKNDFNS